jgi:hypothetical protein
VIWSVVEDHVNKDLLFVGTEFGLFFTNDGGKRWVQLRGGVPTVAFRDLEIHRREGDLVCATFGRGVFILDDYTPLRRLTEETLGEKRCSRRSVSVAGADIRRAPDDNTPNPPFGPCSPAARAHLPGKVVLTVTDGGKVVARSARQDSGHPSRRLGPAVGAGRPLATAGMYRVGWKGGQGR